MDDKQNTPEEIKFADLAPAIEFMCWTVVALGPFLRLVNGAVVTNDQWWIQVFLLTSATVSACSLRVYQVVLHRKSRQSEHRLGKSSRPNPK